MNVKILGGLALLALALVHGAATAAEHSHAHSAPAVGGNKTQTGTLLPTDAALRQGMEAIRATMATALTKRPGPADYPRIADAVEADIDRLAKTCQLPPDSDARLHQLLARMFDGLEALRGPENQQLGIARVLGALNEYGRVFDHPGWRPFGH